MATCLKHLQSYNAKMGETCPQCDREEINNIKTTTTFPPLYQDPQCPKCGLKIGNKMYYTCGNNYCPVGLN